MSEKDHKNYLDEVQFYMMTVFHTHHCKIRSQTRFLEDDIAIDSGSPEEAKK